MKKHRSRQFQTLFVLIYLGFVPQGCSGGAIPEEVFHVCMQETNVPSEIVHKVIAHDTAFDDHSGKCFERCVCVKLGLCDAKDGKLLPEKFVEMKPYLSPDKVRFDLI